MQSPVADAWRQLSARVSVGGAGAVAVGRVRWGCSRAAREGGSWGAEGSRLRVGRGHGGQTDSRVVRSW